MNTNGSMFGPYEKQRDRLRRMIAAGIDLIEFSMDSDRRAAIGAYLLRGLYL